MIESEGVAGESCSIDLVPLKFFAGPMWEPAYYQAKYQFRSLMGTLAPPRWWSFKVLQKISLFPAKCVFVYRLDI